MRAIAVELDRVLETLDPEAADRVEREVRRSIATAMDDVATVRDLTATNTERDVVRDFANMTDTVLVKLNSDEMVRFWDALKSDAPLTPAQERLGAIMRGEL